MTQNLAPLLTMTEENLATALTLDRHLDGWTRTQIEVLARELAAQRAEGEALIRRIQELVAGPFDAITRNDLRDALWPSLRERAERT